MPPDRDLGEWLKTQHSIAKLYIHDFKNPVSVLWANLSYIQAVLSDVDDDTRGAMAESALAVGQLMHLMETHLTISQLESGELPELVPVNVADVFTAAEVRCRRLIMDSQVELHMAEKRPSAMCNWPTTFVNMALDNLILSAVSASPPETWVEVSFADTDDSVSFSVVDGGNPIGGEFMETLFTREAQMKAKGAGESRYGRGMGLYGVGLVAEALGGFATVTSEGGRNRFVLTLPR